MEQNKNCLKTKQSHMFHSGDLYDNVQRDFMHGAEMIFVGKTYSWHKKLLSYLHIIYTQFSVYISSKRI